MFKPETDSFLLIAIPVVNGEIVIHDEAMVIIVVNIPASGKGTIANIPKAKVGNARAKSGVKAIVTSCESGNILIATTHKEEGVEPFNSLGNDVPEAADVVAVDP